MASPRGCFGETRVPAPGSEGEERCGLHSLYNDVIILRMNVESNSTQTNVASSRAFVKLGLRAGPIRPLCKYVNRTCPCASTPKLPTGLPILTSPRQKAAQSAASCSQVQRFSQIFGEARSSSFSTMATADRQPGEGSLRLVNRLNESISPYVSLHEVSSRPIKDSLG